MSTPVPIAYCPRHGLHGAREDCFECGGPVEQIMMIPAGEPTGIVAALTFCAAASAILTAAVTSFIWVVVT